MGNDAHSPFKDDLANNAEHGDTEADRSRCPCFGRWLTCGIEEDGASSVRGRMAALLLAAVECPRAAFAGESD